jgi:predicted DNA-binding transcriptional regulator AlpA
MADANGTAADPDFWDINDIQFHCRIGRTKAWELVREAGFPPPVVMGKRRIWPRLEVLAFLGRLRQQDYYANLRVESGPEPVPYLVRQVRRRTA